MKRFVLTIDRIVYIIDQFKFLYFQQKQLERDAQYRKLTANEPTTSSMTFNDTYYEDDVVFENIASVSTSSPRESSSQEGKHSTSQVCRYVIY